MLQIAYMLGIVLVSLIGLAIRGGLVGLIPFFMARKRGYETMGGLCLILCMAAPFIGGAGRTFRSVLRKLDYILSPIPFIGDTLTSLIPSVLACLICVIVILIRSKISRRKGE